MRRWTTAFALIGLYIVTFLVVNLVHSRFFPVRVVLYDALFDAAIAMVIVVVLYVGALRRIIVLSNLEAALSLSTGMLLASIYCIGVVAVIDRSLSVYILEKLAQRGGAIREDAMRQVFVDEYMREHRLIDIRLTEQLASGTIMVEDGCVRLTPRGSLIAALTRSYRTHLLPKRREIRGVYTDELTDPFRNSSSADYGCEELSADSKGKTK